MNKIKANNHYVPQLYLKQWVDSENKVCIYKTLVSHENEKIWRKKSIASIAYQKHLYTQLITGSESDDLEKWLDKNYESPAQAPIYKAVNDKKLSKHDWYVLVRFLACQDVRTPARLLEHLSRQSHKQEQILQDILERIKHDSENDLLLYSGAAEDSCELDKSFPLKVRVERNPNDSEMDRLRVESYIGRATWIHSLKHLLKYSEKVLHQHKWSIIKPARGYSWPTSDNPVIKLNYTDENNYDYGGGWGRERGNIFFPLSPQHAMFVQIGDKPILKGTRLSEALTKQVKKFIVEHAHRSIFSNSYDKEVIKLRPRIIDPNAVKNEEKQIKDWHEQNNKFEKEFF
ncbi:DUF4238 domain-containing protein [Microbulbifer spongiae]|uniref:DUF4238 domain-containing protein n=1 Tax=Microbulbifer spongiae TaxID=2944933 RepID=A0ABY9EFE6_9GAMM|nr:DUF4238 domain-containing protein [Microbulbifer sp. MI-G]WKD51131.1 DUF4238 domain-containing protein [Microbulbifer sp. MI-G]